MSPFAITIIIGLAILFILLSLVPFLNDTIDSKQTTNLIGSRRQE